MAEYKSSSGRIVDAYHLNSQNIYALLYAAKLNENAGKPGDWLVIPRLGKPTIVSNEDFVKEYTKEEGAFQEIIRSNQMSHKRNG